MDYNKNQNMDMDQYPNPSGGAIDLSNASVGSYVTFGHYEQDGNGAKPIEWEVLELSGNRALLISRYVLDVQPYNTPRLMDVTWETCTLRGWLNNEFLNAAFDANEQAMIPTVTLSNPDNAYRGTIGGNDTNDKIFLLSVDEIRKYYSFNSWYEEEQYGYCQKLITDATQYAIDKGVYTDAIPEEDYIDYNLEEGYTSDVIGKRGAIWWLRSPGSNSRCACGVCYYGNAGAYYNYLVNFDKYGVRPALFVEY